MLKDIKTTTKHSGIYILAGIITKVVGFLLIPIYTRPEYLSTDDFGVLSVLEATSLLLIGLLTMSMNSSLARWYWDKDYKNKQKNIVFTTLVFLVLTLIPVLSIITYKSNELSLLILDTSKYAYLLKLTTIAAGIQIINNQILLLAKLQSKSSFYSIISTSKITISLILIIYGIVLKGNGLNAIWEAHLISECVVLVLLIPYLKKNINPVLEKNLLMSMIRYGFPLMLASISGVLLTTADKYMLSSMANLEKTAVYSLGYRIANTLKVLITASIGSSILPLKMKKMNEINNQRFFSKINTYTLFVFNILLLGLALFSLDILKLITGNKVYLEANIIIPIISYALFFGMMKNNLTTGLEMMKKTKIIGSLIFTTSLLNIGLNYTLIPIYDIYGAAFATLFSQVFFCITIGMAAQKAYYIPYEWKKLTIMITTTIAIIVIGYQLDDLNIALRLLVKILLFIAFPFILYVFNFYDEVEVDNIKNILNSWKNPKKLKENIKRITENN